MLKINELRVGIKGHRFENKNLLNLKDKKKKNLKRPEFLGKQKKLTQLNHRTKHLKGSTFSL